MTVVFARVSRAPSATVSNTGTTPSNSCPPFPGVTPPTTFVPYASIWRVWNSPSRPVTPWTIRRVSPLTRMLIAAPCKLVRRAIFFDDVVQYAHAELQVTERDTLVVAMDAIVFGQRLQGRGKTIDVGAQFDLEAAVRADRMQEGQQHAVRHMRAHVLVHQPPEFGVCRVGLLN